MTNNKVLIDALNQICSMKREAGETTDTYAFNRCWHIATDALASYADTADPITNAADAIRDIHLSDIDAPTFTHTAQFREHFDFIKKRFIEILEAGKTGCQVTGKSAGADMIAKERAEQIEKHHRTIAHDVESNYMGELVMAAKAILTSEDGQFPAGWDLTIIQKMCDKPYPERVVIAGAFLAAEYDRISADPHWEEELRDEFKAGKQPEQQPTDRRLFEAVPVEKELPPVQSGFSRPIIVICTDTLSNASDEQLKEAKFLSPNIDNSDPEFSFNDPNSQLFSSDKVTHWLREVKPRSVQTEVLGK